MTERQTMDGMIEADDAARFAPGTFGCHEALHMAHVLAETVEERLCEHPAVRLVPEWKALADCADRTKGLSGAEAKQFNAKMNEIGDYMRLFDNLLDHIAASKHARFVKWASRLIP